MSSVVREIETKYDLDEAARLPSLAGLPGVCSVVEPTVRHLQATYYDTPHLDLLAAGITLRRRTFGPDAGWHLKLPGIEDRHEVQLPEANPGFPVPRELREIVRGVARDHRLVEVARIDTRRAVAILRDKDAQVLAEVCDDRVQASTRRPHEGATAQSWREWEVELSRPCPALAQEAGRTLVKAGASPARSHAKPARLLKTDQPGSAPVPTRKPLTKDSSCAEVLHPHLVSQFALMRLLDPLVRADVPDAVHQMRVVCRRLRSIFGTYRNLFDSARTEPIRSDLKWLVDELGRPRDLEVLRMRIGTLIETDVDLHPDIWTNTWVDAQLAADHRDAHRRATEAMLAPRYVALLDSLQSTVDDPPWSARAASPARSELPAAIHKDWRRLRHAAKAADRTASTMDRAVRLHDVRKAAKRARYAVEAVEPVFGRDAARFAKSLARLQTILGDHHDAVVTRQKLFDLAGTSAHGSDALPVAGLAARLDEMAGGHEARYRKALARASGSRKLCWLEHPVPSGCRSGKTRDPVHR